MEMTLLDSYLKKSRTFWPAVNIYLIGANPFFQDKNKLFQKFFLSCSKIDVNIRNSASCNNFKRVILKVTRPEPNKCLMLTVVKG